MIVLYLILLELIYYGAFFYLIYRKRELILLYAPVFFFIRNLTPGSNMTPGFVQIGLVLLAIVYAASRVQKVKTFNIFSILLFLYFSILFILGDLSTGGQAYWIFTSIVIILSIGPSLYQQHGRAIIFDELYKMSFAVIGLFIANTIIATATGYAPNAMYGMTSGVVYGHMGGTEFMLVPVALFIYLYHNSKNISLVDLAIGCITFAFILLSFRRSAAMGAILAIGGFLMIVAIQRNLKQSTLVIGGVGLIVVIAITVTDFGDQFLERYEDRFDDGPVVHAESGRFNDHRRVYEDMFVYERYSALFGFAFFDSPGNYAGGALGPTRSLHPDLPIIAHASGLLGVGLYLLMVGTAFWQSLMCCRRREDIVLLGFCFSIFVVFSISGRITQPSYALGFFLVLLLPTAESAKESAEDVSEESENVDDEYDHARDEKGLVEVDV